MSEFFNSTCNMDAIKKIESELEIQFPISYAKFLCENNGGEWTDKDNGYIYLWRSEDIVQYNLDYEIRKYLPKGIVAFGMDGDYGYFFDCRKPGEPQMAGCSFGDLDIAELKIEAKSFEEFIKQWI